MSTGARPLGEAQALADPARPGAFGTSPAISVSDASKSFRLPQQVYITIKDRIAHPLRRYPDETLVALRDVSFQVRRGEFFGIVGPNGSGKSTLLRCVGGIYALDRGEIKVDGRVAPFIELGAGFADELVARDNVVLNCIMLGLSRREAQRRVAQIIELAGLEQFSDLALKNYSSGMRARLGFAIAMQTDAAVLLVDEVLAVGDASFQEKCFQEFERAKAEGRTTLLVSHDMEAIERLCDRALLLDRGRISDIGEPGGIRAAYRTLAGRAVPLPAVRADPSRRRGAPAGARERAAARASGNGVRHFAALVRALAEAQFKRHYLGSVLGYFWSVLRPLMMFGVLYFVLTKVLAVGSDVKHYPLYLLTSIVLWAFFAEATGSAVTCLVEDRGLLRKARFPRLAVPFSVVLSALINLGLNLLVVFAFILAAGVKPRVSWLELPLLVLFLVVLAIGVGTLLSALYARYRDVGQIWAVMLQLLFYGSPVLYAASRFPERARAVLAANPLAVVFTQARHAVLDPAAPSAAASVGGAPALLGSLAIVVALLISGLWLFNREAPRIAERL